MKNQEDKSRRELEFQVGDLVYLKLQPYRQQSVAMRACAKLAPRYYGPFDVIQHVGKVAYKLQLSPTSRIHPVFHISQLKKAVGQSNATSILPPNISATLVWEGTPQKVLWVRKNTATPSAAVEVLIQWEGLPEYEATWEQFVELDSRFPSFHLEDKVAVWAAGNAINPGQPPILFTYVAQVELSNKENRENTMENIAPENLNNKEG
ncbi:uncharacterized protein LOC141686531 [Apium graveolens]|uniref:uncharacterized protein LOC141686531 n=1 Tax=Apium graveolens TaxID=4045 RepID=UPI003D794F42